MKKNLCFLILILIVPIILVGCGKNNSEVIELQKADYIAQQDINFQTSGEKIEIKKTKDKNKDETTYTNNIKCTGIITRTSQFDIAQEVLVRANIYDDKGQLTRHTLSEIYSFDVGIVSMSFSFFAFYQTGLNALDDHILTTFTFKINMQLV